MPVKPAKKSARKRSRPRRSIARFTVSGPKSEDLCHSLHLTDASLRKAEKAEQNGTLDQLDKRLRCDGCGALVGAQRTDVVPHLIPKPRPHPHYKDQPARLSKPGFPKSPPR
jgi:hypothetical protein